MEELNNNYLIYFLILLCICLILFYLFYKLNNKVNVSNQKLDTLDKFLSGVLLKNVIPKLDNSGEDQQAEDKPEEDQQEEYSDEEKYNKEKTDKKSNLEKITEQDAEDSD
jgi:hypothetical protein